MNGANKVIQVAVIFIRQERIIDYTWALQYLRDIMNENTILDPVSIITDRELALIRTIQTQFPNSQHLLCQWHVSMNILAKTKGFFPRPVVANGVSEYHPDFKEFLRSWHVLLASLTKSIYNERLANMRANSPPATIRYCTNTWLIWKENLVAAWINHKPHFGITVTSSIEGCHATIKDYLKSGHGDFKAVFNRLQLFWAAQHTSIKTAIAQQQLRLPHSVNIPLLAAIREQVHGYALKRILQEQSRLPAKGQAPSKPCTGLFRTSFGLPCQHIIWQRLKDSSMIQLEEIHPYWYVQGLDLSTQSALSITRTLPVLDPIPIQGRGRPRGALGGVRPSNTCREPSVFEIPSSSAPPIMNQPSSERLYIVDSRLNLVADSGLNSVADSGLDSGLARLEGGHVDLYQPGTQMERAYMRTLFRLD
jgi:MULE transposase domain